MFRFRTRVRESIVASSWNPVFQELVDKLFFCPVMSAELLREQRAALKKLLSHKVLLLSADDTDECLPLPAESGIIWCALLLPREKRIQEPLLFPSRGSTRWYGWAEYSISLARATRLNLLQLYRRRMGDGKRDVRWATTIQEEGKREEMWKGKRREKD